MSDAEHGFSTRQVNVGRHIAAATPRALPIHLTAAFPFESFDEAASHFARGTGFGYTRIGNPTIDAIERGIAELEGGAHAALVATGQAAVSVAILSVARAGDHIVCSNHIYEGTRGLLNDFLLGVGITTTYVDDIRDPNAWRAAVQPNTRVLLGETISNASNRILDIRAVADVAEEHGITFIVDSTFSTPYLQRPLEHGASLVVHSASKFFSGHGSVLGGVIVDGGGFDVARDGTKAAHLLAAGSDGTPSVAERWGGSARIGYAREVVATRLGPTISPLNAFHIGEGIETLSLRVRAHSANAARVAHWLSAHPAIERVDYAGLESHADHDLAERYLPRGSGSVFNFTVRGGVPSARQVVEAVRVVTHMTHLGDVRSLIMHPASTTHVHSTAAERAAVGVHDGTLRISVGTEDVEDVIADLDQALASL